MYRQKNASPVHTGSAAAHHSSSSGLARPAPAPMQLRQEENIRENEAADREPRPERFRLQEPPADPPPPLQARFVPQARNEQQDTAPAQRIVTGPPVVQRVIAGLEPHQDPAQVPQQWVDQYHADLQTTNAVLTKDQVLGLFHSKAGDGQDALSINIDHAGGDQWSVEYNGTTYRTVADGNGGLHAVHLALSLLGSEFVDPAAAYQAPRDFVQEERNSLHAHLTHADNAATSNQEAQQHISHAISQVDHVSDTGFGPGLQQLLLSASIRGNQENFNRFLDLAYAGYQPERKKAVDDLPKPSMASRYYQTDEFFGTHQSTESLEMILTAAITKVYEATNSGLSIDFSDELYQRSIRKWTQKALQNFRSPAAIKKEMDRLATAYVARTAKKRRLEGNMFLTLEQRAAVRNRLKNKRFRRKVLQASRSAVLKFKKGEDQEGPAKMISEGTLDFRAVNMPTAMLMESLHAFTTAPLIEKKDLTVGSGESSFTSIGQGGLQVKGLGTYPEEINWFEERIRKWGLNPADLFRVLMTNDERQLKELTGANKQEIKHMLSFRVLQIEEIFRGMQFGVGVAAHMNLGFHGQADVSSHLTGMPMYAPGATTNVTQTDDWEAPHDPVLWDRQVESTMAGIEQLVETELQPGQVYNMNAQTFLQRLHDEPIDEAEPSEELIDVTYQFMMSPNPYINQEEDDEI